MIDQDQLDRIEALLDRIACAAEAKAKPTKPKATSWCAKYSGRNYKSPTAYCIANYYDAYQSRYCANPVITNKDSNLIKSVLATSKPEDVATLLQVYLQMDDPWFATKRHDIPTFTANLNKISLALQKGNEQTTTNWTRIFKEGINNDTGRLSNSDIETSKELYGDCLQGGARKALMASTEE